MPKFTRKSFGFNNYDWKHSVDDNGRTIMVPKFNVDPMEKRVGLLLSAFAKHNLSQPDMLEILQTKESSFKYSDTCQPLHWMLQSGMIKLLSSWEGINYYKLTPKGKALVGKKKPCMG